MQEARILHFEDSLAWQRLVVDMLSVRGLHRVVGGAESLGGSLEQLLALKKQEIDANVILLDGRLRASQHANHPQMIVEKVRELGLGVTVVGLSTEGLAEQGLVLGGDMAADLLKDNLSRNLNLLELVLDRLPEPGQTAVQY